MNWNRTYDFPDHNDAAHAEPPRCEICGWPLADSQEKGCIPGDCSYRPDDPAEQRRIRERRAANPVPSPQETEHPHES